MTTCKCTALIITSIAGMSGFAPMLQSAPSVTLTSTLVSDHLFRGQRLGGFSFQPAIHLNGGDSVAGISASIPVDGESADRPDPEIDLYASRTFALHTSWRLTPGFTLYAYPDASARSGYDRAIFEPNLALSYTIPGVRLTSTYYYDLTRKGPILELAAAIALPLKKFGTELDLAASVGEYRLRDAFKNATPTKRLSGNYWTLGASVPFQITSTSSIRIGVSHSAGFNSLIQQGATVRTGNPLAARRVVAQLGYSLSF